MRVIAGKARGHKLKPPDGMEIRPTSDRVKESIFSIIQNFISDTIVLDLFSGTGNLGIEALSRGARKAYFIDKNIRSIEIIRYNLEKTKLISLSEVLHTDVEMGIKKLAYSNVKASIIFMDPPYQKSLIEPTLRNIIACQLLERDGIIVVEHNKDTKPVNKIDVLDTYRTKDYGNTSVTFYRQREDKTK